MHPDLVALLALQADDEGVARLEARIRALDQRLVALDRERETAAAALSRSRATIEAEEKRLRELQGKVEEHKTLQARNLAQLDAVRKAREATAAMAQIDITRKVLAQEESDVQGLVARLQSLRQQVGDEEAALALLDESQAAARAEVAAERDAVEEELRAARRAREGAAQQVSRPLLKKYERIRGSKHASALYALRGQSCGHCNTAIPLQRRNAMAAGGAVEVCEGCGVLLYAAV